MGEEGEDEASAARVTNALRWVQATTRSKREEESTGDKRVADGLGLAVAPVLQVVWRSSTMQPTIGVPGGCRALSDT
jgi:hypothetical protein